MSNEGYSVDRFNFSGEYTHTDYYDEDDNFIGSKVDRYDLGGKYRRSDNYDKHGSKTGTSDNKYNDDDSRTSNSGCFITTAVCNFLNKPDDCYELTILRYFRGNWLKKQNNGVELIEEYYHCAPHIVDSINKSPDKNNIYMKIYDKYIQPCIKFIEDNKNDDCMNLYIEMVEYLKNKYCIME